MRTFLKYAIPVLVVYIVLLSGLFVAMLQPPEVFGRIMSKLPTVAYFLFPFEPMWLVARRGQSESRRTGAGLLAQENRRLAGCASLFVSRAETRSADFRQPYLTAFSPGGSRAQQAV